MALGNSDGKKALIVFDPDPFYNFDEQICLSFGKALAERNISVTVATVAAASKVDQSQYDVLICCANTYNWRPDWSITSYIKRHPLRQNQKVIAITIGAGSTEAAQKKFEKVLVDAGGNIVASYSLWLWRPNDESRIAEPNVDVAVSIAHTWATQLAEKINN